MARTSFSSLGLFLALALCVACVAAGGPLLHREVVNASNVNEVINDIESKDYTSGNAQVDRLTSSRDPSNSGVRGILFDRGEACPGSNATNVPQSSIVLITEGKDCSTSQQIDQIQKEAAVAGVIVVRNDAATSDNIQESVGFPVFYVDKATGDSLISDIRTYQRDGHAVALVMSTSNDSFGSPWQIALIAVGALLAVSVCISVAVHFRLYQLRRRERNEIVAVHEANANAKLDVTFTLKKSVVQTFPTKTYRRSVSDKVRSSIFGTSNGASSKTGEPGSSRSNSFRSLTSGSEHGKESCSICLEDFEDGEELRYLPPCNHCYHIDCIDRWLTEKSSQCPLCKRDCTPPELAAKRIRKHEKTTQLHARLDDMFATSSSSRSAQNSSQRGSRVGFLGWFGYSETESSSNGHSHPNGGDMFGIQEPPVAARREDAGRLV